MLSSDCLGRLDDAQSLLDRMHARLDDFDGSRHPRGKDGKFGSGGGSDEEDRSAAKDDPDDASAGRERAAAEVDPDGDAPSKGVRSSATPAALDIHLEVGGDWTLLTAGRTVATGSGLADLNIAINQHLSDA